MEEDMDGSLIHLPGTDNNHNNNNNNVNDRRSHSTEDAFLGTPHIQEGDEEPLIVSDDPYVQDIVPHSKDPRYAPRDRWNMAFLLMVLIGMGTSYPWAFFVTATDYFQYSFRNVSQPDASTRYQSLFETSLAIVSTTCGFIGLALSTVLSRCVAFRYRVYCGYVVIVVVFTVTTALATRDTDAWQGGFFVVTMGSVFLINLANSIVCGGIFGMQGCLPTQFTTAMMIGQPLAGVVAVLAEVLSILSGDGSPSAVRNEATGYFGSAIAATILCVFAFTYFQRLPLAKYYLGSVSGKTDVGRIENLDRSLGSSDSASYPIVQKVPFPTKLVLRRTWKTGLALILNFFVTMAVYPAIAAAVRSVNASNGSIFTNELFLPLTCFLIMNVGDFIGRWTFGFLLYPRAEQDILTLVLSIMRFALIPLLMLCNAQPRKLLPVFFGDVIYVLLITILAFTNGYLGNLGIMYGPKLVPVTAAETTGTLMGLYLNAGLWLGSILSFALVYFL
ncbi:Equilibrative nucleoside transporter 3 [Hypsibius exemplaris]|uniref:Equilibrative nucleoside transporter 3 n=1 Tax=Hypsibius exemplaris TaxID=2072580 RepID=A0A1W0WR22_HYPEX|nr:Equilibrative nucleoside transporter 3 [Hypsibius exemplaris]